MESYSDQLNAETNRALRLMGVEASAATLEVLGIPPSRGRQQLFAGASAIALNRMYAGGLPMKSKSKYRYKHRNSKFSRWERAMAGARADVELKARIHRVINCAKAIEECGQMEATFRKDNTA